MTPLIEAGRVFLPDSAAWLGDIDELAAFPAGIHDDAVDSTAQALNYLRHQTASAAEPGTILPGSLAVDDRELLWMRAMNGEALSEAEINLL